MCDRTYTTTNSSVSDHFRPADQQQHNKPIIYIMLSPPTGFALLPGRWGRKLLGAHRFTAGRGPRSARSSIAAGTWSVAAEHALGRTRVVGVGIYRRLGIPKRCLTGRNRRHRAGEFRRDPVNLIPQSLPDQLQSGDARIQFDELAPVDRDRRGADIAGGISRE